MKKFFTLILLAIATLIPITFYIKIFHQGLSNEHKDWGEFGSYLSGTYGSLAFIILAYTTHLTRTQFKIQGEDSVFYKLFDSLQYRIQNSSIFIGEKELSAHKTLKHIVERIKKELFNEAIKISCHLLCDRPETINRDQYSLLFKALINNEYYGDVDNFRTSFINDMKSLQEYRERRERLKFDINPTPNESEPIWKVLKDIGSTHFYKIPFDERQRKYSAAMQRVQEDHGEFLDGYFRTVLHIAEVATTSTKSNEYSRYAQSQLTHYEVIILFYMLAGSNERIIGASSLKAIGALKRLTDTDCRLLMIDCPSKGEIENELEYIF